MGKLSEFFDNGRRWCQGAMARAPSGAGVGVFCSVATRWCLLGGAYYCYRTEDEYFAVIKALAQAIDRRGLGAQIPTSALGASQGAARLVAEFNDDFCTRFADIAEVIREAEQILGEAEAEQVAEEPCEVAEESHEELETVVSQSHELVPV